MQNPGNNTRTLLESDVFPIHEVNNAARREKKGGGKPPIWEMVFWWTRKPLITARSIILGAIMDDSTPLSTFTEVAQLNAEKTPHRMNPKTPPELTAKLGKISLLDPFAGFGSIPLEAIRLGVGRVVAVELLPTAYVFLKAVLEYPKWATDNKLEDQLIEDLEKWGMWVVEQLRRDPEIAELYDEDVAVYIGTWEVKCPVCGRYTPLVGNWWLARTKNRRVYMKPKISNNRVEVEIVEDEGNPPAKNINAKNKHARCLLCGTMITEAYLEAGKPILPPPGAKPEDKEVDFYPKLALKDWNEKLEKYLWGEITLEELQSSLARPRLLVKVKAVTKQAGRKRAKKELVFEQATQQDSEKLWRALEKLKQMWGDPDIPSEPLPHYDQEFARTHLWGFDKWFKLFNPRQLLTLVKLVKLIREAGRRVEEEKLKQGWDKQRAHKYAEAVTTYLAIALCKHVNYNSVVTSVESTQKIVRESLSFRGIAMTWNWVEERPEGNIIGSFARSLNNVVEGLLYLINAVSGSPSRVEVVLDDATVLGRLGDERFDLIVTDPPYRDDVAYAELSDFYYVWLKRALSDNDGATLAPRFHGDLFFSNGVEVPTQWGKLSLQEVSYNEGRLRYFLGESGPDHYTKLLSKAFQAMKHHLKNNGLLIVYFAHTSPRAWLELVEAGWNRVEFTLTKTWTLHTESEERVTARGKTALKTSIIATWRARDCGEADLRTASEEARSRVRELLSRVKLKGIDLYFAAFTTALSVYTSYRAVRKAIGAYASTRDIVKQAMRIASEELVGDEASKLSPVSLAYALIKRLHAGETPVLLSSQELITLGYSVLGDVAELKKKPGEKLHEVLVKERAVAPVTTESKGSKVAKQKTYALLSPSSDNPQELKKLAGLRKLDLVKLGVKEDSRVRELSNALDVLHILEYEATQTLSEFKAVYEELSSKYPHLVEEALALAHALARVGNDPEAQLCSRIISILEQIRT